MADILQHRGPDDQGFYQDRSVGFGFRRLSILDLSREGHQPMLSPDGRYAIVYNGEIYNYIELRALLEARGHRFRSSGDTEVLLAAFAEWREDCLEKLNGMWAFLIHDRKTGQVFGSRDRFGVKPLYCCRTPVAILLASEIKAFPASGLYQPEVNWRTAGAFLLDGRLDYGVETFYAGVVQIPAGSYFVADPMGEFRIHSFWTLPPEEDVAPLDAADRFATVFEDSVRLRLRSDVPVGVCLSGGLDSTSIICAMARQRNGSSLRQPLYAFSYNTPEFDESRFLDATIGQTGANLVPLLLSGRDFWESFGRVLAAQDEPVHSTAAVVGYGLMELARRHGVTVILNGQGADETAAGYQTYFLYHWLSLLRKHHIGSVLREINRYAIGRGSDRWGDAFSVLRYAVLCRLGAVGMYRRIAEVKRRRQLANHPWFTEGLTQVVSPQRPRYPATLRDALIEAVTQDPLPLYLRIEDRNSMAHSVEARLPFLDYRLVSLLFSLPSDEKLRGPWNKFILREAMRDRIPDAVRNRLEKFGFPTPLQQWIGSSLYDPLRDLLGSSAARNRGIYRTERVLDDLERAHKGHAGLATPLVRLAQFEMWSKLLAEHSATAARARSAIATTL